MLSIDRKVKEINCNDADISQKLLVSDEPYIIRGFVSDWPSVKAGLVSVDAGADYIRQFYKGESITLYRADPEAHGRVFYSDDFSKLNFTAHEAKLHEVLEELKECAVLPESPMYYVGSTLINKFLPGFTEENKLSLDPYKPMISIWICNQSRIAAHNDLPDNVACCVAGKRQFTLFPPDQLDNLYIGPLDFNPAGRPVSLVDFHNPDYARFPKFAEALKHAQVADLNPGDVLFIPSMWWHHVESLSPFNVLVNYWWRRTPAYRGAPMSALEYAILAIRDLPETQKQVWRDMFDFYVFDYDQAKVEHIPDNAKGYLGEIDEAKARSIRAKILNLLNR